MADKLTNIPAQTVFLEIIFSILWKINRIILCYLVHSISVNIIVIILIRSALDTKDKLLYGFIETMKMGQWDSYMSSSYLHMERSFSCRTEIILWFFLWSFCSSDHSSFISHHLSFSQLSGVSSPSWVMDLESLCLLRVHKVEYMVKAKSNIIDLSDIARIFCLVLPV